MQYNYNVVYLYILCTRTMQYIYSAAHLMCSNKYRPYIILAWQQYVLFIFRIVSSFLLFHILTWNVTYKMGVLDYCRSQVKVKGISKEYKNIVGIISLPTIVCSCLCQSNFIHSVAGVIKWNMFWTRAMLDASAIVGVAKISLCDHD